MKNTTDIAALTKKMAIVHKRHEREKLTLAKPINDQIAFHKDQIDVLEKIKANLFGGVTVIGGGKRSTSTSKSLSVAKIAPMASTKPSGKRDRRSPEELAKIAADLVATIKTAGKEGMGGGAIKSAASKAHRGYQLFQVIPFLDKFAKGHGIKMVGQKAQARYHG